jgi:hypothetical protein
MPHVIPMRGAFLPLPSPCLCFCRCFLLLPLFLCFCRCLFGCHPRRGSAVAVAVAFAVVLAFAVVSLVVIPEGDLLLLLLLLLLLPLLLLLLLFLLLPLSLWLSSPKGDLLLLLPLLLLLGGISVGDAFQPRAIAVALLARHPSAKSLPFAATPLSSPHLPKKREIPNNHATSTPKEMCRFTPSRQLYWIHREKQREEWARRVNRMPLSPFVGIF